MLPTTKQPRSCQEAGQSTTGQQRQGLQELVVNCIVSVKFVAGNVSMYISLWKTLTNDPCVLDIIEFGIKMDFIRIPPPHMTPRLTQCSLAQQIELDHEFKNLIKKRVIRPTHRSPTGYISPIFTTEKKDGSTRLILNLKQFNHYIQYKHIKMENLQDVLDLMKPGVSIDLRDAYYTIPVNSDHQKYLTFSWRGTLYCYTCMPNGYSQAPYIFTKILKVPFAYLRKNGHSSVVYIDDTYLQGDSPEDCESNIHNTLGSRIFYPPGQICIDANTKIGISWFCP